MRHIPAPAENNCWWLGPERKRTACIRLQVARHSELTKTTTCRPRIPPHGRRKPPRTRSTPKCGRGKLRRRRRRGVRQMNGTRGGGLRLAPRGPSLRQEKRVWGGKGALWGLGTGGRVAWSGNLGVVRNRSAVVDRWSRVASTEAHLARSWL